MPILFYIGYYFYALEFKNNLIKAFQSHTQFYYKDYKIIDFKISSLKKPLKNGVQIAFIKPAFTIGEDNNRVIMKFEKLILQKAFFEDEIKIYNEEDINFKILNNSVVCSDIKEGKIFVRKPQASESIMQRFILTVNQNNIYCRHRNNHRSNNNINNESYKSSDIPTTEILGKFDSLDLNFINETDFKQGKKIALIFALVQDQLKIADYDIKIKWNNSLAIPEYNLELNKLHINKNNLFQVDFTGKGTIFIAYKLNFEGKIDLYIHNYQNLFQSLSKAEASRLDSDETTSSCTPTDTMPSSTSAEIMLRENKNEKTPSPLKPNLNTNIEKLLEIILKNSVIKETDLYATLHGVDGEIYVGNKNINLIINDILAAQ